MKDKNSGEIENTSLIAENTNKVNIQTHLLT